MTETVNCRKDLEAAREPTSTKPCRRLVIRVQMISRFEVSHTPDSTTAEFVGATSLCSVLRRVRHGGGRNS